jgi:hypothetical protein
MVKAQRGLIAATGIASGVDSEHHHKNGDAVDPRIGDHGSRVGVIARLDHGGLWLAARRLSGSQAILGVPLGNPAALLAHIRLSSSR